MATYTTVEFNGDFLHENLTDDQFLVHLARAIQSGPHHGTQDLFNAGFRGVRILNRSMDPAPTP